MKKSLVALAALAATSAFAQSSVTISGVLDAGYRSVSGPLGTSTKGGFQNGTATSAILITGSEDLGGGMSAIFRYEINPDFVAGAGFSGSVLQTSNKADLSTAGTSNTVRTSNGANGYNFVGIQTKDMGAIRIGRLNTSTLAAWGVGSVFGTALGSGYGSNGNVFTGATSSLANFNQTAPTRFNGAVEYTTPSFNGFTGRALFVPKVDNAGGGSENNASAAVIPGTNRAGVTDFGLAYNNGPLNVQLAQQSHTYGANAMNSLVTPGNSSSVVNGSYKLTTMAANYTVGAATVYVASWTEKQPTVASTAVVLDASGTMFGAKYTVGQLSYMASMGRRDDKSTANAGSGATTAYAGADKKVMGVGVDYALSKRTNLWARYESRDADTTRSGAVTTNTDASWDPVKTTAFGVRHSF